MKQIKKTIILSFALILISLALVSAITGSIGNARMILQVTPGQTIQKSILVKNVNTVPLQISLFASGDLENYTTIKDANFTLQPGDEKNAQFTIKAVKEGTFTTKINVEFSSTTEKSGVGLSSQVILIASGKNMGNDNGDVSTNTQNNNSTNSIKQTASDLTNAIKNINPAVLIFALSVVILVLLLIVLLIILAKNKRKKKVNHSE